MESAKSGKYSGLVVRSPRSGRLERRTTLHGCRRSGSSFEGCACGASSGRGGPSPCAEIVDHLARGVQARRAGDAAAGVGRGAAHVQAPNRRAIVGVPQHGPRRIELVEAELAMKNVAADKAEV